VILEHSVLGLHYLSSPCTPSLLSCNPLSRALQYILLSYNPLSRALYFNSFQVCITSTSIPASLRCTCFDIARQISQLSCRHSGQTPHRPRRTLRPTDRNNRSPKLRQGVRRVPTPQDKHTGTKSTTISHHPCTRSITLSNHRSRFHRQVTRLKRV
jgi:hypothetical protein